MLAKIKQLDYFILFIMLCFLGISTTVIYSATSNGRFHGIQVNHIVMFTAFLILMILISLVDYRLFTGKVSYLFYGIGLLLLFIVQFKGLNINGAKRWINLGFMPFQPSELEKVFNIIFIAGYLKKRNGETLRFYKDILPIFLLILIPFFLVLKQPDLGTALVILFIMLGMLWVGRVRFIHALLGILIFAVLITGLIGLYFKDNALLLKFVKPYELQRIQTFIDPASDPNKSWQVVNSQIAISAGQLFGQGFKNGNYVQRGRIPYDYADSIFVVIGEEFGFVGAAVLLVIYMLLIYRLITICIKSEDISGAYIISGIISMLVVQIFENIAMHTGLMPLTGIALPFVSYGGSSLLTDMISMGLAMSVYIHHSRPNPLNDL